MAQTSLIWFVLVCLNYFWLQVFLIGSSLPMIPHPISIWVHLRALKRSTFVAQTLNLDLVWIGWVWLNFYLRYIYNQDLFSSINWVYLSIFEIETTFETQQNRIILHICVYLGSSFFSEVFSQVNLSASLYFKSTQ